MWHPLAGLDTTSNLVSFAITTTVAAALLVTQRGLSRNEHGKVRYDIVRLELAGTVERAEAILAAWGAEGRRRMRTGIWYDYPFLIAYSTALTLACLWASRQFGHRHDALRTACEVIAWGQWLAALLDAIENVGLLRMLDGSRAEVWPALARGCAIPKFALVVIGALCALLGIGRWLVP